MEATEAYSGVKAEGKVPYYGSKKDLLWRQKRPTMPAKQTYYGGKRDLLWKPRLQRLVTRDT